jgi:hypothetical protein
MNIRDYETTKPFGGHHCYYCGRREGENIRIEPDHFIPRSKGGVDFENIVPACSTCNQIKGSKYIEDAKPALVQRKLGWPRFNKEQLLWLKTQGFDISPVENGALYYEERPACRLYSIKPLSRLSAFRRKRREDGLASQNAQDKTTPPKAL